jgi:GNAT superfamily N-acetyltransferase
VQRAELRNAISARPLAAVRSAQLVQNRAIQGYDHGVTSAREQTVRLATAADVKPLAAVMARAFYDDPPFIWMLPDPKTRLKRSRRFFATLARGEALARGGVDVALVGTEVVGAAIWRPPGHWDTEQLRTALGVVRAFGRRTRAATALARAMARAHPREPHWYLFGIGVDPARQGSGIASVLLRPRLDRCDHDGLPAYLEASKAASVPLYQHFGFEPTGNPDLPDGAPPLTAMWRPAAAAPPAI